MSKLMNLRSVIANLSIQASRLTDELERQARLQFACDLRTHNELSQCLAQLDAAEDEFYSLRR